MTPSEVDEAAVRGLLVEEVRRAVIHELGTDHVDAWLGKDGLYSHSADELAAIAVDTLWRLLDGPSTREQVFTLHRDGELAPPIRLDPSDW